MAEFYFTWFDYLIFCTLLGLCIIIGVYFGFRRKAKDKDDYLVGGKTNTFAVAASLIASNISGFTLIGFPSDIYQFGAMYIWSPIAYGIAVLCAMFITMPVLVGLESNSIFYYLEMRFNGTVRRIASLFYILQLLLYGPVTIYVPSIILAQMVGFSSTIIAILGCFICVCYTALGGFNAVVWTDTLQTVVMNACLIIVVIIGFNASGGLGAVWAESINGGRLNVLRFSLDPTTRESMFIILFGHSLVLMVGITVAQPTLQRLKSLETSRDSRKALGLLYLGLVAVHTFVVLIGLTIYTRYSKCDPFLSKKIQSYDQVVAYFVMDVGGHIFGLPGLFAAGMFSGGLSSLSTSLNSLSAIIYSDFLELVISSETNAKHRNSILKLIVFLCGGLCIVLTYLIQYLGGIIPALVSFLGIFGGPIVAIYMLGLVFPKSNAMGALVGSACAALFVAWMFVGHYYFKYRGLIRDTTKPMSLEHCDAVTNTTSTMQILMVPEEEVFVLYRISYWYYIPISFIITIVLGFVVSLFIRKGNEVVTPELISPPFRCLLPQDAWNRRSQRYSTLIKPSDTSL